MWFRRRTIRCITASCWKQARRRVCRCFTTPASTCSGIRWSRRRARRCGAFTRRGSTRCLWGIFCWRSRAGFSTREATRSPVALGFPGRDGLWLGGIGGGSIAEIARLLRQNKRGLARTLELQLFPDLHLLLAAAAFQAADAIAAMLDLPRERRVLLLQLADLAVLGHQRLQSLRTAYGDAGVNDHHGEQNQRYSASSRNLTDSLEQGALYVYKTNRAKRPDIVGAISLLPGPPACGLRRAVRTARAESPDSPLRGRA